MIETYLKGHQRNGKVIKYIRDERIEMKVVLVQLRDWREIEQMTINDRIKGGKLVKEE